MLFLSFAHLQQITLPPVHPPIIPLALSAAVQGLLAHGAPQEVLAAVAARAADQAAGVRVVRDTQRHDIDGYRNISLDTIGVLFLSSHVYGFFSVSH